METTDQLPFENKITQKTNNQEQGNAIELAVHKQFTANPISTKHLPLTLIAPIPLRIRNDK